MQFVTFPMCNLHLGAPKGLEDQVQGIDAYRGAGYITICMELDAEEAAALAERRTLFISFMDVNPNGPAMFPPVRPDVMLPNLVPFPLIEVAGRARELAFPLSYLDLNFVALPVGEKERDFSFRATTILLDGEPTPFYDLVSKTHPADLEPVSREYFFKKPLEIVGRFSTIPEYVYLQHIFPNCPPDVLILKEREQTAAAPIIQLATK